MWLCTQHGFYSIVEKRPGEYHVRARLKRDLENLKAVFLAQLKGATTKPVAWRSWKIYRSDAADYRWRLVICQPDLIMLLACVGNAIDYSNFKGRIHERPDQREKAGAYSSLWAALAALQK